VVDIYGCTKLLSSNGENSTVEGNAVLREYKKSMGKYKEFSSCDIETGVATYDRDKFNFIREHSSPLFLMMRGGNTQYSNDGYFVGLIRDFFLLIMIHSN
jgi:hypothetical protein